jgi:hypothetical protein
MSQEKAPRAAQTEAGQRREQPHCAFAGWAKTRAEFPRQQWKPAEVAFDRRALTRRQHALVHLIASRSRFTRADIDGALGAPCSGAVVHQLRRLGFDLPCWVVVLNGQTFADYVPTERDAEIAKLYLEFQ